MHWRKPPSRSNGTMFYAVIGGLTASVATILLMLHHPI
jgi:hypothetical protein